MRERKREGKWGGTIHCVHDGIVHCLHMHNVHV